MFVIPTIAVLFTFVYMRPHEIWEAMRPLNVNVVAALVAVGFVLGARVGAVRLRGSPLLIGMVCLFMWCLITTAIKAPDHISTYFVLLAISLTSFMAVAQGLQTFRAISVAAALLLVFTLVLAALGVYQ